MPSSHRPLHHHSDLSITTTNTTTNNHNHNHISSNGNKTPIPTPITYPELRSEFAHHDPSVVRINNGSFGSCPASVTAAQRRWQLKWLQQPDDFYYNQLKPSILRTRNVIKDLINADDVDEISVVDNATTAAAIVLQHTSWAFAEGRFNKGDTAIILHYAYGAIKKSVHAYVSRAGGRVIEVHLPFPISSNEQIFSEFRKALEDGKSNGHKVRLAVIDHITAMPSVVIPAKELVEICRNEGVDQIFVDAAHGIGCTKVDMKEIGADFYTSNLYKWDYSAQLVVPEVLGFVDRFEGGIEGVRERNHEKVVEMGEMLVEAWGTNLGSPPEMCSSMAMVGLPSCLGISSDSDGLKLRTHLRDCFGVEVRICYTEPKDGEVDPITGYAWISHQVYNSVDDYYKFRDAVNKLVNDGFTCALRSD
ncbi:hypothetical protein Vadar_028444 [Vaccinium darrowii]|uniref:Uncharacterized protein n=1 Tax=Vaccinium darrowii TaxID=229202 RepID=A0ACB7ZM55_9ERIC|nr:hypothetical protein Vadar_028444 [Vaccinium darrowii]